MNNTIYSDCVTYDYDAERRHREVIDAIQSCGVIPSSIIINDFTFYFRELHVLDIGERNLLTEKIEKEFDIKVDNTSGDLDYEIITPKKKYDIIVCSHVIEHLMNPLLFLENAKKLLADNGRMIIAYPIRFIKYEKHFHEIPERDMRIMLDKAGFEVVRWETYKTDHPFPLGIRPILRILFDKNFVLVVKKLNNKQKE